MKRLITILAFVVLTITLKAQIDLEHTYGDWTSWYTTLSKGGLKYYYSDATKLYIYNIDHSVYKTINLQVPSGYAVAGNGISNISDHLINSDDNVEYIITYYKTNAYKIQIESEDGTIIKSLDFNESPSIYLMNAGNNTYKLFIRLITSNQAQVYSLPGTMEKSGELKNNKNEIGNPYPNPTASNIVIPYELPENTNEATLSIYTLDGKEIRQYTVGKMFDNFILNTSDLMKGMYMYNISGKNFNSEMKKFIVE